MTTHRRDDLLAAPRATDDDARRNLVSELRGSSVAFPYVTHRAIYLQRCAWPEIMINDGCGLVQRWTAVRAVGLRADTTAA